MLKNSRDFRIEWGQCDPAGIVFYPRYFEMFDHSTTMLISAASGLTKFELVEKYDEAGYPMVDTRAKFYRPCRYGDDVTIESEFTRIGTSSFEIHHRLLKNGELCLEGFETRVWVGKHPTERLGIVARPLPEELAARFRGG
jgi:4-hydroxybenzoyl-CoA thioesterase